MKAVTEPMSKLAPTDAVSTAGLKAQADEEKVEPISFSLPKKHIRMIRNHATTLQQQRDQNVSASAALRDILERVQL